MRMFSVFVFTLCFFGLWISKVSALDEYKDGFRNVVVGEGCATTCVNGRCESICNGEETKSDSIAAVEKEFAFTNFEAVLISDIDTDIEYGQDYAITLFHVPDQIDEVKVDVVNNTLKVSLPKLYKSRYTAKLKIVMPVITKLLVDGNSELLLKSFQVDDLEINSLGNANLRGHNNRINRLVLQANRNADADFFASDILNAEVNVSDNATVKLNFQADRGSKLSGVIDGMADLLYCGKPELSLTVSDLSDISSFSCD